MALVTSPRFAIQYPDPSRVDRPDVPLHFKNVVDSVDANAAMFGQGAFATRPVSTSGSPGKQGRFYMSNDGLTGGSAGTYILFYDYGTGWALVTSIYGGPSPDSITAVEIAPNAVGSSELADGAVDTAAIIDGAVTAAKIAAALKPSTGAGGSTEALRALGMGAGQALSSSNLPSIFQAGTRAALPANNVANDSLWYYATDQDAIYFGAGGTWHRIGAQAGDVIWTFENTARTGYIICTGQAWPSTIGAYADLFGKWAALYPTTLPDFSGREFVAKGTHADVATLGFNDGVAVANRRPKHKHVFAGSVSTTGGESVDHVHNVVGTTSDRSAAHTHVTGLPFGGGASEHAGSGAGGVADYTAYNATSIGESVGHTHSFNVNSAGRNAGHTHQVTPLGTVGPQTGAEPTDSSAYIVLQPQVKL